MQTAPHRTQALGNRVWLLKSHHKSAVEKETHRTGLKQSAATYGWQRGGLHMDRRSAAGSALAPLAFGSSSLEWPWPMMRVAARGLLSSPIRNSTWGFIRKQKRNSSQGLSAWAKSPKPLYSSPFIYRLQWGLLSSDDSRLQCFIASTAGCFGQLTSRAAPVRLVAKKEDMF